MQIRSSSLPFLLIVGLLGLGLAAALGPRQAQAQTPVTSIVNGASGTALEAYYSGGLLAPGKFANLPNYSAPNDSIPAEGAGTRMMWYPEKAAFRAGRVGSFRDGTQWDAANVGRYSTAFGRDTEASGFMATAMGFATISSGVAATATGYLTTASGNRAMAMGSQTTASGFAATAMGIGTTAASASSLSIGECNDANMSADNTLFVVGNGTLSSGNCSLPSDALVLDESGNLTISGSLTEGSDRRLKTAIEPIDEGVLEKLVHLRPVRYRFKNQKTHPSGEQIGLIAQDVRKEFPALVGEGSGGYLSLAYPKMTAVLLKGIQEQQAQLEKKQAQIDSLKEKVRQIQDVKKRLTALETGRAPSALAGLAGSGTGLLLTFLLGGLIGACLLWRRRG